MDSLIAASKLSNLTQGMFVGGGIVWGGLGGGGGGFGAEIVVEKGQVRQ